jgi:hypothetical protein
MPEALGGESAGIVDAQRAFEARRTVGATIFTPAD